MGVDASEVPAAFAKIQNQFIGILSGVIGASCYNKFKNTKLPDALGFFSGKRCVAIMTSLVSLVASLVLFFAFPMIYNGLEEDLCSFAPYCNSPIQRSEHFFKVARLESTM